MSPRWKAGAMDSEITTITGIEEPVIRQRSFQSMYGAVIRRRRVKIDLGVRVWLWEGGFVVVVVVVAAVDPERILGGVLSGVVESIFVVWRINLKQESKEMAKNMSKEVYLYTCSEAVMAPNIVDRKIVYVG